MKILNDFSEFESFLYSQLPRSPQQAFTSGIGLNRTKEFLAHLGDPQNKLKVIHIAGTSGKGSVAHIISQLLQSQGFKVGLSISPHIADIRERFQVLSSTTKNNLIPKSHVVTYLNQIYPLINQNQPTYFELVTILAYHIFYKENVDYAIIETGLGGTYDATNAITNPEKICIITPINYDHMNILGNTIAEIASQKAGIIHAYNHVFSAQQLLEAQQTLNARAQDTHSPIHYIQNEDIHITQLTQTGTYFTLNSTHYPTIETNLIGLHQAQNITLALNTIEYIIQRDHIQIDLPKILNTLKNIKLKARIQIISQEHSMANKDIIIDTAHNPHKITSLTNTLSQLYTNQSLNFLIAFKKGKEIKPMLQLIKQHANHIYLTSFTTTEQDFLPEPITPQELADILTELNFSQFTIIPEPDQALTTALQSNSTNPLTITGSFYLIATLAQQINQLDNTHINM